MAVKMRRMSCEAKRRSDCSVSCDYATRALSSLSAWEEIRKDAPAPAISIIGHDASGITARGASFGCDSTAQDSSAPSSSSPDRARSGRIAIGATRRAGRFRRAIAKTRRRGTAQKMQRRARQQRRERSGDQSAEEPGETSDRIGAAPPLLVFLTRSRPAAKSAPCARKTGAPDASVVPIMARSPGVQLSEIKAPAGNVRGLARQPLQREIHRAVDRLRRERAQ